MSGRGPGWRRMHSFTSPSATTSVERTTASEREVVIGPRITRKRGPHRMSALLAKKGLTLAGTGAAVSTLCTMPLEAGCRRPYEAAEPTASAHQRSDPVGFLLCCGRRYPDARKVRAAAPCVGCVRVRPTLAFELRAHPSVPWQMARGARRSSTSPSAPTVTQHAEANQAAAQSPTAGGGAPAAGPDWSDPRLYTEI